MMMMINADVVHTLANEPKAVVEMLTGTAYQPGPRLQANAKYEIEKNGRCVVFVWAVLNCTMYNLVSIMDLYSVT